MERKFPVREVKVVYDCDSCKAGEMVCIDSQGKVNCMAGAGCRIQYLHKCSLCKEQKVLPQKYPFITHEPLTIKLPT